MEQYQHSGHEQADHGVNDKPRGYYWVFLVFLVIAAFFLFEEHRAHMLGALPFLLLLACPLMHLFMHHGHDGHDKGSKK